MYLTRTHTRARVCLKIILIQAFEQQTIPPVCRKTRAVRDRTMILRIVSKKGWRSQGPPATAQWFFLENNTLIAYAFHIVFVTWKISYVHNIDDNGFDSFIQTSPGMYRKIRGFRHFQYRSETGWCFSSPIHYYYVPQTR